MFLHLNANNLRSFSDNKHFKRSWGSDISIVPNNLRYFINLFSFKHSGVDRLAQKCTNSSRIIDFGSGNCSFSMYFASKCNCTVIAVDWSYNTLKAARLHYPHLRIIPVCADLHCLPFKNGVFSAFITIDTFGHLYNVEKALDSLHRTLQPGACGFFHSECADYRKHWPDSMLISINGRDIPAESDGHISLLSGNAIVASLKTKFTLLSSFSPAGYLGWLTGYPEKYVEAFARAGNKPLCFLTNLMSEVRKNIIGKALLRLFNYITNRIELFLNFRGGGSFFADVIKPVEVRQNSATSIDIIIPTYRREKQLNSLLDNLLPQCRENDSIIIVSQDDSLKLEHISRHIHLLHNSPPNLPDARNRGLYSGTNEIVLFLDDDTLPCEDLLEKHRLAYLDSNINCIAGSIADTRFLPSTLRPSLFDFKTGELIQNFAFPSSSLSKSFMGAHFSFRRSVLKKTGLFDTSFTGNAYWEDIDFSFRMQKKGYQIHYNPEISVTHLSSVQGGCRSATRAAYCYSYFTNSAYFAFKYAPLRFIPSWFNYWKYRIEFETRSHCSFPVFKHNPFLLGASFLGIITAVVRFLHKGKRIGIPETVIHQNDSESS